MTIPMKIKPMNAAIKKSISGSASATAVFNCRSSVVSVTVASRMSS